MQKPFEFKSPTKGVNKNAAYGDHDPDFAISAVNVLPWDRQGRLRANQRAGSSKLWAAALGAPGLIQLLAQTTLALDPNSVTADVSLLNEPFTYADGNLETVAGAAVWKTYSNVIVHSTAVLLVSSNKIQANTAGEAFYQPSLTLGSAYVVKFDVTIPALTLGTVVGIGVRQNTGTPDNVGVFCSITPASTTTGAVTINIGTALTSSNLATITSGAGVITAGGTYTLELRVNGDVFQVYFGGIKYLQVTSSNQSARTGLCFGVSGGLNNQFIDNFQVFTGKNLTSYRQTNLVAVSSGNIYEGDIGTQATLVAGGTSQLNSTVIPQGSSSKGFAYFVDGFNIRKLDLSLKSMVTYTATAGSAPTLCTLAAFYRDRLCLAAPRDNPQNFFFTRVGTHTDWDYSQTDSAAAFAGNASVAGRIGEPIVSLMPFSDDVMLIGGDHNLWAIRGDPADGGSIDQISDAIGILGANAWTKAPDGTIYFVGTGGLYKMDAGTSTPQNISSDKWNDYFAAIDRSTSYVLMAWDRDRQGAYIFITPVNSSAATHLWFDGRTGGFWPIQLPDTHGPLSALVYDGDGPNDRAILLGGRAGYVRKLTQTDKSDDGTAISSSLVIGPFKTSDVTEAILEWLDVILGEPQTGFASSDYNVTVQILAGQTVEKALNSPLYTRSKTFTSARRQIKWLHRTRGPYFFLKLSNSTLNKTWNFETAIGMFLIGGMVRRR